MSEQRSSVKIRVEGLSLRYREGAEVLRGVNFEVSDGEFVVLVGPSGCGKTTLLNAIASLIQPEEVEIEGKILIDGRDLREGGGWAGSLGYVSQKDTLFPWRTVLQNVESGLEIRGRPKADRLKKARELIAMAGLSGFEQYYPRQISPGMRQRTALIRSLAYDPELILMDEPFGALDVQARMTLQGELLRIWARSRKTVIFVTHDLAEALTLGERIILFSGRPGTVTRVCPVPLPHPRDPFEFYGSPEFAELQAGIWKSIRDAYRGDARVPERV